MKKKKSPEWDARSPYTEETSKAIADWMKSEHFPPKLNLHKWVNDARLVAEKLLAIAPCLKTNVVSEPLLKKAQKAKILAHRLMVPLLAHSTTIPAIGNGKPTEVFVWRGTEEPMNEDEGNLFQDAFAAYENLKAIGTDEPAKLADGMECAANLLNRWSEAYAKEITAKRAKTKGKTGRRPVSTPSADEALMLDWTHAKASGAYKPQYETDKGLNTGDIDRASARIRARKRTSKQSRQ